MTTTRLVLPDGNGRDIEPDWPLQTGDVIRRGDLADWPELNGWQVGRLSVYANRDGGTRRVFLLCRPEAVA